MSLALILRSVPPKTQKIIFEHLPLPIVQKISEIDLTMADQLSQEDLDNFSKCWPEFTQLIHNVQRESKIQKTLDLMHSERSKIREYMEYKLGNRKERPNLSFSIAKIVDELALN